MFKTYIFLKKKFLEILEAQKLFSYFTKTSRQSKLNKQNISLNLPRVFGVILVLLLPFLFSIPLWLGIMILVPPLSYRFPLRAWFGPGENIVAIGIILIFCISLYIRWNFTNEHFHKNRIISSLISSSPYSLKKASFGILLNTIIIDYWIITIVFESYLFYHLILGIPIDVFHLIILICVALFLSISGSFVGLGLGIGNRGSKAQNVLKRHSLQLLVFIVVYSVFFLALGMILKNRFFFYFTPLGWVSLEIYFIFVGLDPPIFFFLFSAISLIIFLLLSITSLNLGEQENFYRVSRSKTPSLFYLLLRSYSCLFFRRDTKILAENLFKDVWKGRKILKFVLPAIILSILIYFLLTYLLNQQDFSALLLFFDTWVPTFSLLFSVVAALTPLLDNTFCSLLFNYQDNRFYLFKSTPKGIIILAKIYLIFIFLWQVPFYIVLFFLFLILNPMWSIFDALPFILGIGFFLTSFIFMFRSFRPLYPVVRRSGSIYDTILVTFFRIVSIFTPSMLIIILLYSFLPSVLVGWIYFGISSLLTLIFIKIALKRFNDIEQFN